MTALAPSADTTAVHGPTADPAAARALMSAVLDAALDAVVAIDGGGRVVEWNPAAERMFGYRAADALGRELAALIVPAELRDRQRAGLARHVAGGSPVLSGRRIEMTARRASGARFPAQLTITRVAVDGEPLFVVCVRDSGDRHRAEAQLRASRARIVAAADAARRRIERGLHDGAQQHLVALAVTLQLAAQAADADPESTKPLLEEM